MKAKHMQAKLGKAPTKRDSTRGLFDDGSITVKSTPSSAMKHDIYLFGPIEDATQFIEAIDVLLSANEGDVVIVHLSTYGGSCDATDTFIDAMLNCRGRVLVSATGGVCSAGTLILLAADEFRLSENFYAMCHNGSFGAGGKASDVKSQVAFEGVYMDNLMRNAYWGFMTEEEIDALIAGKDFWMDGDEFLERVERRRVLEDSEEGVDTENEEG